MEKPAYPVIDAHAHLDELPDAPADIENARKQGVVAIAGVGMDRTSNERILQLAGEFPGYVIPCIGLHPWNLDERKIDDELSFIDDNLVRCAALGEVGLDYKAKAKKPFQKRVFKDLLGLAKKFGKPAITHSRYSHETTYNMVVESGIEKAIFHWYSGPLDVLDRIVANGFFVSVTPALAYSAMHREAARHTPLDNLILETDCPVQYEDLKSRPEHVLRTLELAARVKEMDPEAVARATTKNAAGFFRIHFN